MSHTTEIIFEEHYQHGTKTNVTTANFHCCQHIHTNQNL